MRAFDATSRTEMRRRIRAHKYFSHARFGCLMGDAVVETSRLAEEKSAVFEFVIDIQSVTKRTSFSLSLIRSEFSISLIMMLTKRVLSLSLSLYNFTGELQDFQKSCHQGSRRVLRQRRCGTFFFPHLLFWIEFTKDSKVTPY